MHEIKKIMPFSLAKYTSLIAAISILFLAIVRLIYFAIQNQIPFSTIWQSILIDTLMQTILSYAAFWIIGYLFALLYNVLAKKSRGILIDFKEIDLSLSKHKRDESKKDDKKIEEEEDIKIESKFVV